MTRAALFSCLLVAAAAGPCLAEEAQPFARGNAGQMDVIAMLLPMTHEEFVQVWETPRTESPNFTSKPEVAVGQHLLAVVLFSNPVLGDDGSVSLSCRSTILHPDDTRQVAFDGPCKSGIIPGPATDLYTAGNLFGFPAPDALAGQRLVIAQVVSDINSGKSVELTVSVDIVAAEGGS
jgi:hypothetical protein